MNGVHNVQDFGAVGDGVLKNTQMIQGAIDQCAQSGGGIVFFPPGVYVSGTIYLRDNICLDIAPGAVLMASPDREDYNADDFCPQNRACLEEHVSGAHLLVALEVKNVTIRGGGRIDGRREAFMNKTWAEFPIVFELPEWRPAQMLFFCECANVTIEDVELYNAPYWTCFLHGCDDVAIHGLRIWNDQRTHNGDGIDIDCCRRVTVSDCNIDSGDDCITLRANCEPLKDQSRVCEHVVVTNCALRTTRCNAIRVGVGGGAIRDCLFNNIVVRNSRTGVCVIGQYLDQAQAEIRNIMFDNIILDTQRMLVISSNICGPQDEPSRMISDISFNHVSGRGCHTSLIQGNTDSHIQDIAFLNARFEYYGGADIPADDAERKKATGETSFVKTTAAAVLIKNARDIEFKNVKVTWGKDVDGPWEKALDIFNVKNLVLDQFVERHA